MRAVSVVSYFYLVPSMCEQQHHISLTLALTNAATSDAVLPPHSPEFCNDDLRQLRLAILTTPRPPASSLLEERQFLRDLGGEVGTLVRLLRRQIIPHFNTLRETLGEFCVGSGLSQPSVNWKGLKY